MRIYLCLAFTTLLVACEDTTPPPWQKFLDKDNVLILRDAQDNVIAAKTLKDGNQHGVTERYYSTGELASRRYFVNGLEQGVSEFFYDNGQIKVQQNFVDGLPEGEYRSYYPGGELRRVKHFEAGLAVGEAPSYFPNGEIQAVEHYKNGKLHGVIDYFDNSGQWIRRETYIIGTLMTNEYPNAGGGLDKQIMTQTAIY